jgi:hypothetical protein
VDIHRSREYVRGLRQRRSTNPEDDFHLAGRLVE